MLNQERMTSRLVFISGLILCMSCGTSESNQDGKENVERLILNESDEQLISLKDNMLATWWIEEVYPNCFDTIKFETSDFGSFYSCEHAQTDSISYALKGNELLINLWKYKSEVNAIGGKEIYSKYYLFLKGNILELKDLKHKHKKTFISIDEKFLNHKYKRVK